MSISTIEIGLPFFSDISEQGMHKPYFNSFVKDWVVPNDRVPTFQVKLPLLISGVVDFDIVDVSTGVHTSLLSYYNSHVTLETVGNYKYAMNDANIDEVLPSGRYYIYLTYYSLQVGVASTFRYSEVFRVGSFQQEKVSAVFSAIDIGLPFYNNIECQLSKKEYFTRHLSNWLSAGNNFLPFQINAGISGGMASFDLINSVTGAVTDMLSHFNSYALETVVDGDYYYTYNGRADVSVPNGRYYFHAISSGGRIWFSEEFTMCGNIEEQTDYLLIGEGDYLLIGGTDRLIIN